MQKTVREWGKELLPEPYKSQFMENLDNPYIDGEPNMVVGKMDFVDYAFTWAMTPQGDDYWDRVDSWAKGINGLPIPCIVPPPPTPTERQTAEALLKEFGDWWHGEDEHGVEPLITKETISAFLTSKYGKG